MISAIILAGGLGTRLRQEVPDLPKPMAPINGKPFLEHLITYWNSQGISHFHLSLGYMHEKIQNYFGNKFNNASISYSIEETPVGTGGGLKLSLNDISSGENFLLLNGDTFFKIPLKKIIKFHLDNNLCMTLNLFQFNESNRYGEVILDEFSSVTGLKPKSESTIGYANGGVYMINKNKIYNIFKHFEKEKISFESDIIPHLIFNDFKVKALKFNKPFLDIGIPKDYRYANIFFNN